MGIIGWIVFGFIVGLIARAIMPGKYRMGLIATTILGVGGALLAGWLGSALGWYEPNEGAGFIAATVGAIIVLFGYNRIVARRSSKSVTDSTRRAA